MGAVRLVVMVGDESRSQLDRVAGDAEAQGLLVEQVLPLTGLIIGSADTAAVERLSQIQGVAFVREEEGFQLPPPEAGIPQ